MFKKITIATIVLSGLMLSATSQAAEVSVEQHLGSLVAQAASVTKLEISNSVQKAVLTANNAIGMESEQYATSVTITDLHSDPVKVESDKAE